MKYTQLKNDYKYDTIAEAVYGREMEHFHYQFDLTNFEHLLAQLPDGPYRDGIAQRCAETKQQMRNVEMIYDALLSQVDDEAAYAAAVERAMARRAAQ